MIDLREAARDVRCGLSDPGKLALALGLLEGSQRQGGGGILIRCPVHGDRNPSCSVSRGPDGTVRVKCFACDFSADAIGLVAQVLGLETRGDGFRGTLAAAAELGGLLSLAAELRGEGPAVPRAATPRPTPAPLEPPREYPPAEEVNALWAAAGRVSEDTEASGAVVSRRVNPEVVDEMHLARVLDPSATLPRWATYHGCPWTHTGHRLVVRAWDSKGVCRSVRAWRVTDSDSPKRLPPAGHRAAELVLANQAAVRLLRSHTDPGRLLIVEGEPDWLVACVSWPTAAVIGIGSGSWSEAFAARVPEGSEVLVMTHPDPAGERYAEAVAKTLGERVRLWRAA